jgi:hypothetical protein
VMPPTIKRGAATLSRMTFVPTTLSIKGLLVTHSITTLCYNAERRYAECHILFIVMLSVVMLTVVMLNVFMPNVIILSAIKLNVIMLSVMALQKGLK